MADGHQERVGRALEALRRGLRLFVESAFRERDGEAWAARAAQSLRQDREWRGRAGELHLDAQALLALIWQNWNEMFQARLGRAERSLVSELMDIRNRWAHQEEFSGDDAYRALDSAGRLLTAVGAPEASDLEQQKRELMLLLAAEAAGPAPLTPREAGAPGAPATKSLEAETAHPKTQTSAAPRSTGAGSPGLGTGRAGGAADLKELERRFHQEMVAVYQSAKARYGYVATRFLTMVNEKGGVRAAKELLRSPGLSDGLIKLWELQALDMSMEARIVENPAWHPLFSEKEIAEARKRLRDLKYEASAKPDR